MLFSAIQLTKAMLGYKTDDSISSIDNSEDGYVPGPSGSSEEGSFYEENLTGMPIPIPLICQCIFTL
jgi:hypothetical protein